MNFLERPYISQWYAFKPLNFLLNTDDHSKLELTKNVSRSN